MPEWLLEGATECLPEYLCACQEVQTVEGEYDESLNQEDELVELPRQTEAERRHVHQPHHHLLRGEAHGGQMPAPSGTLMAAPAAASTWQAFTCTCCNAVSRGLR